MENSKNQLNLKNILCVIWLFAFTPNFADAQNNINNNFPHPDFSGVWQTADPALIIRPELNNPPLTDEARKWADDYKQKFDFGGVDDPAKFCVPRGMPWTMMGRARDYPAEIIQTEKDIIMRFEVEDTSRRIRIGETEFPQNVPESDNGYSIAHWEGQTLVVETRGMMEHTYPDPYLRSPNAKVIERLTRTTDPRFGDVIIDEIILEDPLIYKEPARGYQVFKRSPEGTYVGGYNCPQSLWRDHIEPKLQ